MPFYLTDNIYFDEIRKEDYDVINKQTNEYTSKVNAKTKCIYIVNEKFSDIDTYIKNISTALRFTLNMFSSRDFLVLSFGFLIEEGKSIKLSKTVDILDINYEAMRELHYKLKPQVKRKELIEYFKILDSVIKKFEKVIITLERFNSSLMRSDNRDKIIDITTSLESLINTDTEINFKFSLYNTLISHVKPEDRERIINLLKNLYKARSNIVHGSKNAGHGELKKIMNEWGLIVQIAKACINYYIFYLGQNNPELWNNHLRNLTLGIDDKRSNK